MATLLERTESIRRFAPALFRDFDERSAVIGRFELHRQRRVVIGPSVVWFVGLPSEHDPLIGNHFEDLIELCASNPQPMTKVQWLTPAERLRKWALNVQYWIRRRQASIARATIKPLLDASEFSGSQLLHHCRVTAVEETAGALGECSDLGHARVRFAQDR